MLPKACLIIPISIKISIFKRFVRTMMRCIKFRFYIFGSALNGKLDPGTIPLCIPPAMDFGSPITRMTQYPTEHSIREESGSGHPRGNRFTAVATSSTAKRLSGASPKRPPHDNPPNPFEVNGGVYWKIELSKLVPPCKEIRIYHLTPKFGFFNYITV